jgi:hypothetical protein
MLPIGPPWCACGGGVDQRIAANGSPFPFPFPFPSLHFFHGWCAPDSWSRFVSLKASGGVYHKTMVPFFDLMNHSPAAKTAHAYDEKTKAVRFTVMQRIDRGEQVFLNYGPLGNASVRVGPLYPAPWRAAPVPEHPRPLYPHTTHTRACASHRRTTPLLPWASRRNHCGGRFARGSGCGSDFPVLDFGACVPVCSCCRRWAS